MVRPRSGRGIRQWEAAGAGLRCAKVRAEAAWWPFRTSLRRHSEGAGPDLVRGAMSRLETGANAYSCVAASRRDEALPRAPDTSPAEEQSQGGGRGQGTCAGGGQRGSFGLQQPEGAGIREPPLSFMVGADRRTAESITKKLVVTATSAAVAAQISNSLTEKKVSGQGGGSRGAPLQQAPDCFPLVGCIVVSVWNI